MITLITIFTLTILMGVIMIIAGLVGSVFILPLIDLLIAIFIIRLVFKFFFR